MTGRDGRIRVTRVITRLNVGGPALHAMLLTRLLDQRRYEATLVCGVPDAAEGDMLALRPVPGVRPIVVGTLRREISLPRDIVTFFRLIAIFRALRPDIVHTHLAKAGLLGRLAARVSGVPIVVHTYHGNVFRGYFGGARSVGFRLIERALARASTRVVSISPQQSRELRSLGIASGEKVVEIPLGLDLAPFLEAPAGRLRAELAVGPDVPLVGLVARLVPIKGVDVFLDAAARIAAARPAVLFVVVGEGELSRSLRTRAEALGILPRVRFLGWRDDLPAIYADLDVAVLTSHNEGTPVTIIEALASGKAVVATAVGGVPDLLADASCGVLVPDGDVAGITAAVIELIDDPPRRALLGAAGRRRVHPAYDVTTLARRVEALYEALLTGR